MDAHSSSDAAAGGAAPTMHPPGFQSASSVLKATGTPASSGGTMRNASGGLPPIPKPQTAAGDGAPTEAGAEALKPVNKFINRPVASKNAIVYSGVQRRNPVLQSIKNVGIQIGEIVADYQVGTHNGVLFLSLKYHRLHPEYIHQRIEKMKNMYTVRILLVLCDVNEHQQSLRELSKIAIVNNFTTFVAWSNEEVAQYLTTFKAYEHKGDETLKEPIHQSYHEQFSHVMTSGKKVNKTDAENLASQFGSFANISKQPSKVLSAVKGLGATKVTSLVDSFSKPFLVGGLKREGAAEATDLVTSVDIASRLTAPTANEQDTLGSPEWADEGEDDGDGAVEQPSRGRERVPSRSPGLSPARGPQVGKAAGAAWQDPLDDDEDEDEDEGAQEPASKRARVAD